MSIPPRTLKDPAEIVKRLGMLAKPHVAPLALWVETLRTRYPGEELPDFDPFGGGIEAEMLFILEKPGPQTSRAGGGSGFISVNNNDATAENSCRFLDAAGIAQARTCHWNVIPGWDRAITYKASHWRLGLPLLSELLDRLPRVSVIVLVGNVAARAYGEMHERGYQVVLSAHPSTKVRNMNRAKWDRIPQQWAQAVHLANAAGGH